MVQKMIGGQLYSIYPYSHWRIKEILDCDYGCQLVNVTGYKESRYGKSCTYNVVDNETKEIVMSSVTLDALRILFTKENYPLHDNERG